MTKANKNRQDIVKENKYHEEDRTLHAEKAEQYPASLNKVTKENNPV